MVKGKNRMNPKSEYTRQLVYLASGIMLATLLLLIIPSGSQLTGTGHTDEVAQRLAVSDAADQYLVANTPEERQAAARMVRAAREGSRSVKPVDTSEFYAFLRVIALITIVLLLWRTIALTSGYYKPERKVRHA